MTGVQTCALPIYRLKIVETCNICTSMAVLEIAHDTIGTAPLLLIIDGMYDLAWQAKVEKCCAVAWLIVIHLFVSTQAMKDVAPSSTSLLVEFCMMLSRLLNTRMASVVHFKGTKHCA